MSSNMYSIWIDRGEQWLPEDADQPVGSVLASGTYDAALQYMREDCPPGDGTDTELVVRDDMTGTYYRVRLAIDWCVREASVTSLAELCAP